MILGNKIGTAADGVTARGNGNDGVVIASGPQHVVVGGVAANEANTIAYNSQNGVRVTGDTTNSITARGNSIHANTQLGIDLAGIYNNADPLDLTDSDTGPNGLQNFPRRTTFTKCDGSTETKTVLRSAPSTTYTIDFYANPSGYDSSGYGEGEQYLSSTTVTTDATGYAQFTPLLLPILV